MKRKLLFVISLVFTFLLTGCYGHNEIVKLIDIKFYDINNNEISGVYKNYFREDLDDIDIKFKNDKVLLNSPAPVVNFYCARVDEGASVRVVMKFQVNNSELKSLKIMLQKDKMNTISEMDKIEVIDDYTYVTLTIENISTNYNLFEILTWSNGEKENYFGTRGGNTYIRGFYFKVNELDNENTVI